MASRPSCRDLAGDERRNTADLSSQRENVPLIPLTPRPSFPLILPLFLSIHLSLQEHLGLCDGKDAFSIHISRALIYV